MLQPRTPNASHYTPHKQTEGDKIIESAILIFKSSYKSLKWFNTNNSSLENSKPIELLKTSEGRVMVKNALKQLNTNT